MAEKKERNGAINRSKRTMAKNNMAYAHAHAPKKNTLQFFTNLILGKSIRLVKK